MQILLYKWNPGYLKKYPLRNKISAGFILFYQQILIKHRLSYFMKNARGANNNSNIFTFLICKFIDLLQYITFYIYLYKITFCFKIYFNISSFYSVFHAWLQFLHNYPPRFLLFTHTWSVLEVLCKESNSLVPSCFCVCSLLFLFFRICSNLPLSSPWRLTLSPTSGDSFQIAYFYFSDKRGPLTIVLLFFCDNFHSILLAKCNPLVPSFLSGGQNWNVN